MTIEDQELIEQLDEAPRRASAASVIAAARAPAPADELAGAAERPIAQREQPPVALRDVRARAPLLFLLRRVTLRRILRVAVLLAIDFVGVAAALFTTLSIKLALNGGLRAGVAFSDTRKSLAFAYLVVVLMFARVDLYGDRPRRPGLPRIFSALFQATVVGLVFALATGGHFHSYGFFIGSLFFGTLYLVVARELYTRVTGWLLDQAGYRRRVVLIGSGGHVAAVAQAIGGRSRTQVDVVGYLSSERKPQDGLRALGGVEHLERVLERERIDEVIVADPEFPPDQAVELVDRCHRRGVTVHVAPTTIEVLFDRAVFAAGSSVPLFTLRPPVFEGVQYLVKRSFDLVLSIAGLVLLSPVLAVIALAVRLSSPGPVIYRSVRPGIGGRPFHCFKFRTMREHAERSQEALEPYNELSGALFKIRDDPRLTPVGRLLRRFSLDELPQLVNVVRGEMSLVGPRPLPMRDYERLEEWHKKRYLVLPGITGLWQVSGRAELDFDDLVRLDFLYLERWSILLDLTILLKTIPAVLSRRGAY
ncbi:MAG TPA: sugar transferase [Solirubrobacteraceae bacterium]|nr:sugar transferase [Solirubrobacteraceae bacterium]